MLLGFCKKIFYSYSVSFLQTSNYMVFKNCSFKAPDSCVFAACLIVLKVFYKD